MERSFGFWRSLRKLGGEDIFSVELGAAIAVGIGGGVALLTQTKVGERHDIASDFLIVIGPLLGVVFAAFALVIALLADTYLIALSTNKDGVPRSSVRSWCRSACKSGPCSLPSHTEQVVSICPQRRRLACSLR